MTCFNKPKEPEVSEPPEKTAKPPPEKKSLVARLARFLLVSLALFVLLIAGAGVAVEYYLPPEKLRTLAQNELSKFLQTPVTIGSVDLNLWRGVKVDGFAIGLPQPLLRVQSLVLDYGLTELLQGKFIINELRIDRPEVNLVSRGGIWNFQPILEQVQQPQPAPATRKPTTAFPIPVTINLKQLLIGNIKFQLDMDEGRLARLEGLTLSGKGRADASGIDFTLGIKMKPGRRDNVLLKSAEHKLKVNTRLFTNLTLSTKDLNHIQAAGNIRMSNNSVRIGKNYPAPDLGISLSAIGMLKQQVLKIDELILDIAGENRIAIAGEVERYLTDPAFRVLISSASLDIQEMLQLAGGVVPLPPFQAKGRFLIDTLEVSGKLANNQPENINVTGGILTLDGFSMNYPEMQTAIGKTHAAITLKEIKLEKMLPQKVDAAIDLAMDQGKLAQLNVKNFKHHLQFSMPNPEQNDLHFSASAGLVGFTHPQTGSIETGFNLQGNASGNFMKGHLNAFDFDFKENQLAKLRLTGSARDFGRERFSVTPIVELQLNKIPSLLPKELREKIGLQQLTGGAGISAKLDGKLDRAFKPLSVNAQMAVAMKNLNTQLNSPPLKVTGLGLQTGFSARFDPKKGIEIPAITLDAAFQDVSVMENYSAGPTRTHSIITVAKPLPLAGKLENIPLTYQLRLEAEKIHSSKPVFETAKLTIDSTMGAVFSSPQDIRNLTLEGDVSLNQADGMGVLAFDQLQANLKASVKDLTLAQTQTALQARVLAPRFKSGDLDVALKEIGFEAETQQDLQNGTVDIRSARLTLPAVLALQTSGHLENWGETFSLKHQMAEADLAALMNLLPKDMQPPIEGLQGTAALFLSAHGKLPGEEELKRLKLPVEITGRLTLDNLSTVLTDQDVGLKNLSATGQIHYKEDRAELDASLDLGRLQKEDLQAAGRATLSLQLEGEIPKEASLKALNLPAGFQIKGKLGLENASLSAPNLELKGIGSAAQLAVNKDNVSVSGELAIQQLFKQDVLGEEWLAPKFVFNYHLENWDNFSVNTQKLTAAKRGVEISSVGRVEKLKPFFTGKLPPTPGDLARHLDMAMDTHIRLQTDQAAPVTPTFKTDGLLDSRVILKLSAGKSLELDGEVGFEKLSASIEPAIKVNDINGKFLFNKKLLLDKKEPSLLPRSVPTAERGYFDQLREFSPYKNILRIASVQFDELQADRIDLDLLYKDNQLRVEKFLLDVLSGSVAGNLFLRQTVNGPRIDLFVEFTGLNTEKLTGGALKSTAAETEIDGNIKAGFQIAQAAGNEKFGLDRIDLKVAITRIGDEALDRLMLFLDPQESQPVFVTTRDMLKLASPHKVLLTLEHGSLSLDTWLKNKITGSIIQAPSLKRLAVGNLKNFQQISGQLQKLSALQNVFRYLAAQGILFAEEQKITLF